MSAHRQTAPHRKARPRLASVAALVLALSLALGGFVPNTASAQPQRASTANAHTVRTTDDDRTATPTETATATATEVIVFAEEPTATETATSESTATPSPEPSATETSTTEPDSTETDVLATATVTPEPATATPTPAEPTATATPSEGPVELEFVETEVRADHGGDAEFTLIARNGSVAQTVDLATSSTNDWTVELLEADGETPLTDSDDDDRLDLGRVEADAEHRIVITVAVPEGTLAGVEDTLTVRVPGHEGVRATLTVNPMITVELGGPGASFGSVNMLGALDPSISGLTSLPDEQGATYIKTGAVQITVTSNTGWTLSCSVSGSADLTERDSGMAWRATGTETWNSFATSDKGPVCAKGEAGTTVITLDLSIRVDLNDGAERLRGTIHFTWDN